jgi:hypothetical protein
MCVGAQIENILRCYFGFNRWSAVTGDGPGYPRTPGGSKPAAVLDVTIMGHQFRWGFQYPNLGTTTANAHSPPSRIGE